MSFQKTSLNGSGKEIIRRVLDAHSSQLLIPPRLAEVPLHITDPPEDGKYIGLFSSGSTGTPKCIWNKEANLLLNGELSAEAFEIEPHHFLLMMAAPWHVAGFTWALMAEQLNCEYEFITTKKGDDERWLKCVQEMQPDYLLTVPAVLRALYNKDWFVEHLVYGGYSINFEEYEQLAPHCSFMHQGYGQTEAGGLISSYKRSSSDTPFKNENLCHGKPIAGAQLKCDGTPNKPEPIYLTSQTAYTDESYNTGDWGYKDNADNIYLLSDADRQKKGNEKAIKAS
jgi:acyl-coenzyme A synthetase/AMP-(fatty) acid ligase